MSYTRMLVLGLGLGLASPFGAAHHSTAAIYDQERTVEMIGTITEWRFVNPHPSMTVEVEEEDGQVYAWDVSYGGSAVPHLRRRGIDENTFEAGDRVRVVGFPARLEGARGIMIRQSPESLDGKDYPR